MQSARRESYRGSRMRLRLKIPRSFPTGSRVIWIFSLRSSRACWKLRTRSKGSRRSSATWSQRKRVETQYSRMNAACFNLIGRILILEKRVAETDYKSTLKLPKTDFPMKANLPKREPEMLKHWDETDLYGRLMEARKDAESWVLHDGPPYANGRVHLGTALNKILKDFVVRSRSMMGFRTPFVPGWDCHGILLEFKDSKDLGSKARNLSKIELRRLCHAEAEKWIDIQRKDFMRLECVGDWLKPYITMDPAYDAAEI